MDTLLPQLVSYSEPVIVGTMAMFVIAFLCLFWSDTKRDKVWVLLEERLLLKWERSHKDQSGENSTKAEFGLPTPIAWVGVLVLIAAITTLGAATEGATYLVAESLHNRPLEAVWKDSPKGLMLADICPGIQGNAADISANRWFEGVISSAALNSQVQLTHSYSNSRQISIQHLSRGLAFWSITGFFGTVICMIRRRFRSQGPSRNYSVGPIALILFSSLAALGYSSWYGEERAFHRNSKHDVIATMLSGRAPMPVLAMCCPMGEANAQGAKRTVCDFMKDERTRLEQLEDMVARQGKAQDSREAEQSAVLQGSFTLTTPPPVIVQELPVTPPPAKK